MAILTSPCGAASDKNEEQTGSPTHTHQRTQYQAMPQTKRSRELPLEHMHGYQTAHVPNNSIDEPNQLATPPEERVYFFRAQSSVHTNQSSTSFDNNNYKEYEDASSSDDNDESDDEDDYDEEEEEEEEEEQYDDLEAATRTEKSGTIKTPHGIFVKKLVGNKIMVFRY